MNYKFNIGDRVIHTTIRKNGVSPCGVIISKGNNGTHNYYGVDWMVDTMRLSGGHVPCFEDILKIDELYQKSVNRKNKLEELGI